METHKITEKNHRILIVDDNEAIHDDFRKILGSDSGDREFDAEEADVFGHLADLVKRPAKFAERLEFELSFASQGIDAMDLVQRASGAGRRFSVVFMDVRMPPGWDGLETALKLWEIDPDLQVVICTAYSDKSWEEMMEKLGNPERVLILKKPFDTIEVLQLAHALTEKWWLLQESRSNHRELERLVGIRTQELISTNSRLESEIAAHHAASEQVTEQAMLLEKARDAIIVRNFEDKILFWNQGAERLYGWTSAEASAGRIPPLLYSGTDLKEVSAARKAVMDKGSWLGELTHKTKEGQAVTVECHWTLVCDNDGRPKSVLEINTDITEKKLLESKFLRAQRLESIGTLAGGIAHDLNNILQPISLAMEQFRTQITDPSSIAVLDLVSNNAQRATALVKQVLSFARGVEGDRLCIRPKALVTEVTAIISETFPKSLTFESQYSENTWPILGDSTQLHQVLLNLCVNARDAMPQGGALTLTIENTDVTAEMALAQPDAAAGRYVVFTVSDTGAGIPASLRDRIFDPFFTTKEQGSGTGLGLATSLSIVRSHGGFINFESEANKGTTFRVYIPASAVAPERAPAPAAIPVSDVRGQGELLLVVDDESTLLTVLRRTLEANGYRVISAVDGEDALCKFALHAGKFHAVVTDMVMPKMDGPALINNLKQLDPNVKIIATTGMASQVSLEMVTRLGVQRILAKPYAARTMLLALKEVLGQGPIACLAMRSSTNPVAQPKPTLGVRRFEAA